MTSRGPARWLLLGAVAGLAAGACCARMTASGIGRREPALPGSAAPPEDGDGRRPGSPAAPPIGPPSSEELSRRIEEANAAGYLTIVAIIQGVALGAAILATEQQLIGQHGQHGLVGRFNVIVQALVVLASIVTTTHAYIWLTMNMRWAPTIFDTLVPYALGVGEVSAAVLIGHTTAWWVAMSVLLVTGIWAFSYTHAHGPSPPQSSSDDVRKAYSDVRKSLRARSVCCYLLFACSLAAALMSGAGVGPGWLYVVLTCGVFAGAVAVAVIGARAQNSWYAAMTK